MVLRIGHRGAAGHAPENTLVSFRKAIDLGCDVTELDVHICGSGELVVIHDETVDRTTNGSGLVSELNLNELKHLDAGKGELIPTLDEVLRLLKDRIQLNIELKGLDTAKPVYELVNSTGWRGSNLLITSFNWDMLKEYRKHDPEARLGPLTHLNLNEAMGFAVEIEAYCINPYHKLLTENYIEIAHSKGFKVNPWTVNNPKEIMHLINLSVDGIISDYPDFISNV